MVAGLNPNVLITNNALYHGEFRVKYLNPPYMSMERPQIYRAPKKVAFNVQFHLDVPIPMQLKGGEIKVALMDLGFSSHAFHSSSRLVFMEVREVQLSKNGKAMASKAHRITLSIRLVRLTFL